MKITETVETLSESRLSKSANKGGTSSWNPRGLKSMEGRERVQGGEFRIPRNLSSCALKFHHRRKLI